MKRNQNDPVAIESFRRSRFVIDAVVLLLLCTISQTAAFSQRMGRATACNDSYQYIAQAEALLHEDGTPNFEMRKPGYPLFLAGILVLFGQLGWVAVVANHVLCGLLPVAGYGFGVLLHSRVLGWIAALLVMVRLQFSPFPNLMMSEPLYMFLLTFGLLALLACVRDGRRASFLAAIAGILLGAAWFTRSAAVAVIVVAVAALIVTHFRRFRPVIARVTAFLIPIVAFALLECSLNARHVGSFRMSHGAAGANLFTTRLCYVQGVQPPQTPAVRTLQNLLPERTGDAAFRTNLNDQWVAMTRATRDRGLTSSQFDSLCMQAGWDSIRGDVFGYVRATLSLMVQHLLRSANVDPPTWHARSDPPDSIDLASTNPSFEERVDWDGRWCLPQMTTQAGVALARRVQTDANQRAPLDRFGILATFRYIRTWPGVTTTLTALNFAACFWPGFALLLCVWLGLSRSPCVILAAMYVADALLHGAFVFTDYRYQGVWLVTDTVLAAALPAVLILAVSNTAMKKWFEPLWRRFPSGASTDHAIASRLKSC